MDQNQNPNIQPDFNQTNQPSQADLQNQQTGYQQAQYQQPYQQQNYQQSQYQQPYGQPQYQQQMPDGTENSFDQSYQAPVYPGNFQAVKKKINPLAIIIPAALLVIAAVVILIIVFSQKPNYRKAEENYFNNTFGSALSSVDDTANKLKNKPESFRIQFDVPSNGLDIPSFLAKIDTVPKGDSTYTEISFSMDDIDLSIQGWINNATETVHIFFPELSDVYTKIDLGEITAKASEISSYNIDYDKYYDALKKVLSKVADTYFELVGDPEIENNQSFQLEGQSYNADKCVITLDSKQIEQLVKALFNAMIDDDELMGIIADMSGGTYSASEIKSELNDWLYDLDDVFDEISDSNFSVEMIVYMKKNTIIGREIKLKVSGLSAVNLSFYDIPANDGRVIAFKTGSDLLSLMSTGSNADALAFLDMTFLLEDKEKGDVHSGSATFKAGSYSIVLDYEDMALTDELCQGKAELHISEMPAFNATLELSKDGDNKIIELYVPNICTVTVTEGPSELSYKDLPDIPSNKLIIIDSEFDADYLEGDEAFLQLIEDFCNAFGIGNSNDWNYFEY